jgi:hypothetical protein
MAALAEFGFGAVGLSENDFAKSNQVIQLGVPSVRIDLITSISGVSWKTIEGQRDRPQVLPTSRLIVN